MDKHQKITERTLYPFIGKSLEEIGFKNVQEISAGKRYIDLECFLNSFKLIIEVKIEDPHTKGKNLLEGVAQAWEYSKSTNAVGFIVIEYPTDVRRPLIFTPEAIEELANQSKVSVIVLTDFWTDRFTKITPLELFNKLKERTDDYIARKEKYVSLDLAVDTIREAILTISGALRRYMGSIDNLINTVVGRFDLFLSLAEEKEEKLRMAAIDLSSYLLVNQILFYHIYASLTKKITDLDEAKINSVFDLKDYFKKITDINYKAIYSVDVVSELPDIDLIIENVKNVIRAIKGVRAASIKHDLIGRIYHESLPFETRKRLATFYTKPVAAEILAGLCIDKWDKKVIDIACGSGTLLVAAYRRKEDLYKEKQGREKLSIGDIEELHNLFVKEQITGLDIMPFACHLTAVNLSAQNPHVTTNKLRVAVQDSLSLQDAVYKSKGFKESGIILKPFSRTLQETLVKPEIIKQTYFSRNGEVVETKGAISSEGIGEEFTLYPSEVVIMNPPFSDREKMPEGYRKKLKTFDKLIAKCGNQVNLWGFFLALADDIIKEGGTIGAVLPINIARGKATEKIRNYILDNYQIKYIVKPVKELAFSESSVFRDILVVMKKRKSTLTDKTAIVLIKQSTSNMSLEDAKKLIEKLHRIPIGTDYLDSEIEIFWVEANDLREYKDNLMPFIGISDGSTSLALINFLKNIYEKASKKLIKIPSDLITEGFHASPAGLSELIFITRPINKNRIKRAFLIFEKETKDHLIAKIKNSEIKFKIEKEKVSPALRTLTNIKCFDITKTHDYIIQNEFKGFEKILAISKWKNKGEFKWNDVKANVQKKETYLAVARRFRPNSDNTHHFAFCATKKFLSPHTFKLLRVNTTEESKINCLFLNSVVTLVNITVLREQTTEDFSDIMESDLTLMRIIDVSKLSLGDKEILLSLFDKLRNIEFPSIIEQLKTSFWARTELDKTILSILGFSDEEIDEWLPKVYSQIGYELKRE